MDYQPTQQSQLGGNPNHNYQQLYNGPPANANDFSHNSPLPPSSISTSQNNHYNGMPRSRQQQQFEDMLLSPTGNDVDEMIPRPGSRAGMPRTSSAMSFGRRISTSSVASGRNGATSSAGFFGWGKKKYSNQAMDDLEDDEEGGGGNGRPEDVPDISMNELTVLRDRDRYPTFGPGGPNSPNPPSNGRTMSISSTMSSGGFDTTPVIPTLRTANNGSQQNGQYRKNLTNSLKQSIRGSDGRLYGMPGNLPPMGSPSINGGNGGYPMQQQRSFPPPHHLPPGQQRPPSFQNRPPGADPRLRSMTGPPNAEYNLGSFSPQSPNQRAMSMSMTGGGGYYGPPSNSNPPPTGRPQQRLSRPPSRLSQQHSAMVTTSTMTDPIDVSGLPTVGRDNNNNSSNASTNSSDSAVDGTVTTSTTVSSLSATPVKSTSLSTNSSDINELRTLNKTLLDEVRLVTSELADSIRRELGVKSSDDDSSISSSNGDSEIVEARERAQKLIILERELDLERRKRMIAQQKYEGDESYELLTNTQYKLTDLEKALAEKDRLYGNEKRETEILRENISTLTSEYEELQLETNQLKNGILPELKSHVADLEVLTAAGNPIELLKQIEELKVENKKLQGLVEENSMRGPLGEKIKAVESQRDALREALRSLKERNDHEIRQSTERVRQLEGKLEKEKVISNQIQRKFVQTRTPNYLPSLTSNPDNTSPSSNNHHTLSTSTSSGSLNSGTNGSNNLSLAVNGNETLSIPKRRGLGALPGITAPAVNFNGESRPNSPSPVNFEISQEPAWMDYVNPSKLPVSQAHARQFSSTSYSSQISNSSTSHSPSESISFFKASSSYRPNTTTSPTASIPHSLSTNSLSLPNGRTEQLPLSLATTST